MKRYEKELRGKALARMREVGVKKTGEELGVSIQTLYKWRGEGKERKIVILNAEEQQEKLDSLIQLLKTEDDMGVRVAQLEAENSQMRKSLAQIRRAFMAMFE